MRLLLVNPKLPESFWSFKLAVDTLLSTVRTINPPLGLATLAAMCPQGWEVEIIDENVESIPLFPEADIIGICGMGTQFSRQKELLTYYRNEGYFVIAGGSYASLCPEKYESLADTVIAGEAEYIWKEFCRDFEKGNAKRLYQETGIVAMADSPVPRFDLLRLEKYQRMSLQFSRGCPFSCEFCDIIVMFGRKPRTKSLEQIGKELDMLRKLNVNKAFFVDDNFIGNKKIAKDLLKFLIDYQRKHGYRFSFGTEVSLNIAHDDELLELFQRACFEWVFIGIESPDEGSLKETKKFQNTQQNMLYSIRKIYSYGIEVLAGFIIGFDNDTMDTFDIQYRFIKESGIQAAMVGLLTALPKTPLYERLEKEERLLYDKDNTDNTKVGTNIIPKQMGYDEMLSGYRTLHYRLLDYRNIADRIRNKIRFLIQPIYQTNYSLAEISRILYNFFVCGLMPGGFRCFFHFFRSIPFLKPRLIPVVIQDWIVGLAMRDYVDRHFNNRLETEDSLDQGYLEKLEKVFGRYLRRGALELSIEKVKKTASNFSISFKGLLDRDFFIRAPHYLEKLLKDTTSSLTLHIEELNGLRLYNLERLLHKLSPYGDRISISVNEKLRDIVTIDSSIFNLILEKESGQFGLVTVPVKSIDDNRFVR
ncbi:MAG: radical SAM protein [Thermodesulfobacteriota bacterium]|nr:radical SAM protein [Thermodesulfobacteriota bacterium]